MRSLCALVALICMAACAEPASAHHSFASVFDKDQPIELTGTVTKVEWMNPHVWFYIDVQEGGETESWGFEMGSPNGLVRRGWAHDALQVGAVVTVAAVRARDGSHNGSVRTVILSTGESLFGAQDESR